MPTTKEQLKRILHHLYDAPEGELPPDVEPITPEERRSFAETADRIRALVEDRPTHRAISPLLTTKDHLRRILCYVHEAIEDELPFEEEPTPEERRRWAESAERIRRALFDD